MLPDMIDLALGRLVDTNLRLGAEARACKLETALRTLIGAARVYGGNGDALAAACDAAEAALPPTLAVAAE